MQKQKKRNRTREKVRHRLDTSGRGLLVLLQFAHLLDFFSAITALITVQPCLDQAVNPSG